MKFTPDDKQETVVPFLDDARASDGWQGHTTSESVDVLRSQISTEIGRLGGTVTSWMRGEYEIDGQNRAGVKIEYSIMGIDQIEFRGRIDVAGLPWKKPYGGRKSDSRYGDAVKSKKEKSLAMALYNVREALKAMRILQMLSPGYSALIPWLLRPGTDQTFSELWGMGSASLPAPRDDDVIDSGFTVISERE